MSSFHCLPDELLTSIFERLTIRDRVRFRRVCSRWHRLTLATLNSFEIHFHPYGLSNNISGSILDIPLQRNWSSFTYLGLPLAKEHIKGEVWTKHIEKMRGLLQSWGVSWLNLAGRTVLIKAVLSGLPTYQYAVIMAPVAYINIWSSS